MQKINMSFSNLNRFSWLQVIQYDIIFLFVVTFHHKLNTASISEISLLDYKIPSKINLYPRCQIGNSYIQSMCRYVCSVHRVWPLQNRLGYSLHFKNIEFAHRLYWMSNPLLSRDLLLEVHFARSIYNLQWNLLSNILNSYSLRYMFVIQPSH